MDKKSSKPQKEKRRNSEKRKEKSRDAARCRRGRETEIFTSLSQVLPLATSTSSQLDKASIMRLAISYLRVRNLIQMVPVPVAPSFKVDCSKDHLFLRALHGFLLVMSTEGDIVFISDNIQEYLGIPQIELMGQSLYEVSHPCDHAEIRDVVSNKTSDPHSFFMRMKCTITSKGRNVNIKSASYKVIHCTGHVLKHHTNCKTEEKKDEEEQRCLVAIGEPIPHPSNIEIPLDKQTFLSKHSLDMRFTYADDKMCDFLGYKCDDLIGQSVYEYYHASDSAGIEKALKNLFSKGQCVTGRYRFLAKTGGYVWVLTQATLIYGAKPGKKPQSVVCVNFVISGIEHKDEIYSCVQLTSCEEGLEPPTKAEPISPPSPPPTLRYSPGAHSTIAPVPKPEASSLYPHSVTAKLFHALPPVPSPDHVPEEASAKPLYTPRCAPRRTEGLTASLLRPAPRPEGVTAKLLRPAPRPEGVTASLLRPAPRPEGVTASVLRPVPRPEGVTAKLLRPAPRPEGVTASLLRPAPRPEGVTAKLLRPAPRPEGVTAKLLRPAPPAQRADQQHLRPQAATAKIFAPKTEDMNKGFLIFSDEEPGLTMLKDEPEDLTHLAPTAGDECVSLEGNAFMSDMFDDLLLGGPLDDTADPFLAYREDADLSHSPHLPALDQSPMPSLSSPESPDDMTCLMSLGDDSDVDEELSMRAPYIPMGEGDDLPLLISADLLWGPLEPPTSNSCLEQLLRDEPHSVPDSAARTPGSHSPTQSSISDAATRSPIPDTASPRPMSDKATIQPLIFNHNEDVDESSEFLLQICKKKGSPGEVELPPSPLRQKGPVTNISGDSLGPERANKRGSSGKPCTAASKRSREEGSGELLRHLMTAGGPPPRESTPQSDSVLMNLLVSGCDGLQLGVKRKLLPIEDHMSSKSLLLDPDTYSKPQLLDPGIHCKSLLSDSNMHRKSVHVNSEIHSKSLLLDTNPQTITSLSVHKKALLLDRDKYIVQNKTSHQSPSKQAARFLVDMPSNSTVLDLDKRIAKKQTCFTDSNRKLLPSLSAICGTGMPLKLDKDHVQYSTFLQDPEGKVVMPPARTSNKAVLLNPDTARVRALLDAGGTKIAYLAAMRSKAFLSTEKENPVRSKSYSLLDPDGRTIPSLVDLSQRDCEVNAPLNGPTNLLHGQELLTALEVAQGIVQ